MHDEDDDDDDKDNDDESQEAYVQEEKYGSLILSGLASTIMSFAGTDNVSHGTTKSPFPDGIVVAWPE